MENKIALVNKKTKRVENIILVESFNDAPNWATDSLDAVPITPEQIAYLYGEFDGKDFKEPTNEYLISIGILNPEAPKEN